MFAIDKLTSRLPFLSAGKPNRAARRAANKGGMSLLMALSTPVIVLFAGFAVDNAYVNYRRSLLTNTAVSAANGAAVALFKAYQSGGSYSQSANYATVQNFATTVSTTMMPSAQFGTVLPAANVVTGTWDTSSNTFTATNTSPNAVQVTALSDNSNSNPIHLFFGGIAGVPISNYKVVATATYGTGTGGGNSAGGFNTIILNDLSGSFSSEISNQRAVDNAILDCLQIGTNGQSKVGLTTFDGHPATWNPTGISGFNAATYTNTMATTTAAHTTTMKNWVSGTLNHCGTSGMPACSGSNVAAGLYSAYQQLSVGGILSGVSNVILVTDGVPNASQPVYSAADGMGVTPSSTINSTYSFAGCTTACNDTTMWNAAQAWAAYLGSKGVNVWTIYYSGDTTGSLVATYTADLASLAKNNGKALVAPTASSLSISHGAFCGGLGAATAKLTASNQ